jgi:serine O-acetyltransferase
MSFEASLTESELTRYVISQLETFFPDGKSVQELDSVVSISMKKLEICINSVRMWEKGWFDHLHSSQYCIFLYLLAHEAYTKGLPLGICNKLFYLNKALNGIDLFYEIEMPPRFFIGHTSGIVLCKAEYGDRLVLYQNSTIGKNNGMAPRIGPSTIVYPHASIIGECTIGEHTTIAHGCRIKDCSTPGNCLVFNGVDSKTPLIKRAKKKYIDDYFRE